MSVKDGKLQTKDRADELKLCSFYISITADKYFSFCVNTWSAKLDTVLQSPYKVCVAEFNDVQTVGPLHVFDPLVGLALGIDHEGPSPSVTAQTGHKY